MEAISIYLKVRDQVITAGMSGITIALDIKAVKIVMDLYNIINQKDCLEKILIIFNEVQRMASAERELTR